MLQNVKCYFKEDGKMACIEVDYADSYAEAIWQIRSRVLMEEKLFEVKAPVMALVQQ